MIYLNCCLILAVSSYVISIIVSPLLGLYVISGSSLLYCLRLSFKKFMYLHIWSLSIVLSLFFMNWLNSFVKAVLFYWEMILIVLSKNSKGLYNREQKSMQFWVARQFSYMIQSSVLREWSNKVLYSFSVFDKYWSRTLRYFFLKSMLLKLGISSFVKKTPSFKMYPSLSIPYYENKRSMFCSIISPKDSKNSCWIFFMITPWSTPKMFAISNDVGTKWASYNLSYSNFSSVSIKFFSLIYPCFIVGSIIFFYSSTQKIYAYPALLRHLWKYSTAENFY